MLRDTACEGVLGGNRTDRQLRCKPVATDERPQQELSLLCGFRLILRILTVLQGTVHLRRDFVLVVHGAMLSGMLGVQGCNLGG